MSKYQPLADYLAALGTDEVRLTFQQIEDIIGSPLPGSAGRHLAWWANSRTSDTHVWAHLWLRAGWEANGVDLNERLAEFRRTEFFDVESPKAREGYEIDQTILSRGRNPELAAKCKLRDGYACQACGFRLQVGTRWVIEAHHISPLALAGETETTIDQLVSLCPTCHRISHLRSTPYSSEEIRGLLGQARVAPNTSPERTR